MSDTARYGGSIDRVAASGEYGFIGLPDGGVVFLHHRDLINRQPLEPGAQVVYSVVETSKGLRAVNVEMIGTAGDCFQTDPGDPPPPEPPGPDGYFPNPDTPPPRPPGGGWW